MDAMLLLSLSPPSLLPLLHSLSFLFFLFVVVLISSHQGEYDRGFCRLFFLFPYLGCFDFSKLQVECGNKPGIRRKVETHSDITCKVEKENKLKSEGKIEDAECKRATTFLIRQRRVELSIADSWKCRKREEKYLRKRRGRERERGNVPLGV